MYICVCIYICVYMYADVSVCMPIYILLEHFLFSYLFLACIRYANFTWVTEKPNSNEVNKKQERCHFFHSMLLSVIQKYIIFHNQRSACVTSTSYVCIPWSRNMSQSGLHGADFTDSFSEKGKKS